MRETVNVGDKVKDTVTGLVGVAVVRSVWLNGCVRIGIQPQGVKDGKVPEMVSVDEPQLEVVKRKAVAHEPEYTPQPEKVDRRTGTGGHRPDAVPQSSARR